MSMIAIRHLADRYVARAALVLLVGLLATYRLTSHPSPWFDEGFNLQAARSLARSGHYGLIYYRDLLPFHSQLTTGPTVIVPVALVFKAVGVGLVQARTVMLVYSLLAALGLYRVGRVLYGPTVAILAVIALCATDRAGPGATRDVVGEIAALAYLCWGIVVFVAARGSGRTAHYAAAGVLLGLAVLTKGQFGLLLPVVGGVWLLTRGRAGGFSARQLLVLAGTLIAPQAAWQSYQLIALGPAIFFGQLHDQSANASVSVLALPFSRALSGARYLLFSPFASVGLAALVYAWLEARRRGWRHEPAERLLLPAFGAAWLMWYLSFSAGFPRYAVPLIFVCCLFLAVLFRDLAQAVRAPSGSRAGRVSAALMLVLALPVVIGFAGLLLVFGQPTDSSAQEMAGIISREVGPEASVESMEWQLDVLTERHFHHPPPFVPAIPYEVPTVTTFLVDGPMAKSIELYRTQLERREYRLVAVAGQYDLYRRGPVSASVP